MTDFGPIPDGTSWVDAYGRPWVAHGDDLILWEAPAVTLLGDNPQKMRKGDAYVEAGATAVDAEGTDITASIVIDTSAIDVDTIGNYPVVYTATDKYGQLGDTTRDLYVRIDENYPEIRDELWRLLKDGMVEATYVYPSPAEQIKTPAVVIGSMSWRPDRMNSLDTVEWSIAIKVIVARTAPIYGVVGLETISLRIARLLLTSGYRVEGWEDESTSTIGGGEYLTGTLSVIYRQSKEG